MAMMTPRLLPPHAAVQNGGLKDCKRYTSSWIRFATGLRTSLRMITSHDDPPSELGIALPHPAPAAGELIDQLSSRQREESSPQSRSALRRPTHQGASSGP